ncbi:MAG: hypothetical protein HZA31_12930 [Opitutae bacterium]|nr:hypothetical protein [Opitutae bacterium]
MAWRIDEHLLRGEIDNRTRGRVTGRLWFAGRAEPVSLDLTGNAWRDLAGRRLEFVNPDPRPGLAASLAPHQTGATGDITASRKVKVPDIPLDQIGEYAAAGRPFPWHWGNSLYLEWFSAANGRVVIESAAYQLTVSPEATWDMTPAEETAQRAANAATLASFTQRLAAAAPADPADDEPGRPLTEAEAEKLYAQSEKLTDRIMARIERDGLNADIEQILSEELERARLERGEPEPTPEQAAARDRWIEEVNAAAQEALQEDEDDAEAWKRCDDDNPAAPARRSHPLATQAFALVLRVRQETESRDWIPDDAQQEHPVAELTFSLAKAGAKLAGALGDADDWPPPLEQCASTIVRLKRAAGYFEDATLAAESCQEEALVDPEWLTEVRRETETLAAETETLIAELRALLQLGLE